MITKDAVDGPGGPPGRLGGMVTRVMALYWEDVEAWRFFSQVRPTPTRPRLDDGQLT
jgi:hypothetical protein